MAVLAIFAAICLLFRYMAMAIRKPDSPIHQLGKSAYVAANSIQLVLLNGDWAYGALSLSPLDLAERGYGLVLIPSGLAVLQLICLMTYGWRTIWLIFTLAALNFVLFIPSLLWTESQLIQDEILFNFLAQDTLLALGLSTMCPFLLVPGVLHKIPRAHTRLWSAAFRGREALLKGIPKLAQEHGWHYEGPCSILQTGHAEGRWGSSTVRITTPFRWIPFRHQLRIEMSAVSNTTPPGRQPEPQPYDPVTKPTHWTQDSTCHVQKLSPYVSIQHTLNPKQPIDITHLIADINALDATFQELISTHTQPSAEPCDNH